MNPIYPTYNHEIDAKIDAMKAEIKTKIFLAVLLSFAWGFILSGILIKAGVITV